MTVVDATAFVFPVIARALAPVAISFNCSADYEIPEPYSRLHNDIAIYGRVFTLP
jgi:hypothetical protein